MFTGLSDLAVALPRLPTSCSERDVPIGLEL